MSHKIHQRGHRGNVDGMVNGIVIDYALGFTDHPHNAAGRFSTHGPFLVTATRHRVRITVKDLQSQADFAAFERAVQMARLQKDWLAHQYEHRHETHVVELVNADQVDRKAEAIT